MRSAHCAGQNKAAVAKVRAARVEVRCCSMLGESPSVPLRCIVRATDCCLCPECATEVLDCQDSRRLEKTCENFEENSKWSKTSCTALVRLRLDRLAQIPAQIAPRTPADGHTHSIYSATVVSRCDSRLACGTARMYCSRKLSRRQGADNPCGVESGYAHESFCCAGQLLCSEQNPSQRVC